MKKLLKKIVAVGLSAAMMLSSAVSAFAEETVEPAITKLSVTELTLEEGATSGNTVTATVAGTATLSAESENADIASVAVTDKTITVTPKKAGIITVDVAYGKAESSFKVKVTPKAVSYTAPKFYSDSAKSQEISSATGLYENGGKVAPAAGGDKVDYKTLTIYTNATLAKVDPNVEDAKVEEKEGKLYVAVTKKDATAAPVSEGKVVKDADGAKILKASLGKNGDIKLTAVSAGTAKVWIMDIGANKKLLNSAVIEVTVLEASANVAIGETKDGKFEIVKSATVVPGEANKATFEIKGLKKDKETAVASPAFELQFDEKTKTLFDAEKTKLETKEGATTLTVVTKPLTEAKVAKGKLTVYDTHSGKKSSITINVADTVSKVTSNPKATDLSIEKKTADVELAITTKGGAAITTDKAKVYVVAKGKAPYKDDKGKISVKEVSRKDLSTKLSKDGKTLTLTAKDNYSTCDVYVAYTCASSKTTQIVKVATVTDGVVAGVKDSAAAALAAKPTAGGATQS